MTAKVSFDREQLKRVRKFLKLETVRTYRNGEGVKRCVRGPLRNICSESTSLKAGGKHLRGTQAYPGSFGLKARIIRVPKSLQVGELMASHFRSIPVEQRRPRPDQGMAFQDTADEDSDDSGLETIV